MWTAEDVKKARQGSGKWTADMVKNIRAGNKVNINDPINQLSPLERDRAEQARRSKMGTTKNMTPEVKTSVTPKSTANNVLGLGIIAPRPEVLETGKKGLDEAAKIGKAGLSAGLEGATRGFQNIVNLSAMGSEGLYKLFGVDTPGLNKEKRGEYRQASEKLIGDTRKDLGVDRENMSGAGGLVYDTATNIPQMMGGPVPFFLASAGGYAQDAEQKGANLGQSLAHGLIGGTIESTLESKLGAIPGIKNLKNVAKGGIKGFLKTAAGEALEEAITDPLIGLSEKAIFNKKLPLYSTTQDAVINPSQMGQSALGGGLMTAMLAPFGLGGNVQQQTQQTQQQTAQQAPIQAQVTQIQAQQEAAPTVKPRQESEILQKRRQAEQLRREYEQIKATSKLTPDELTIADNIRKGKLSAVPQGFNAQIINEVANAGRLYDQADGEVKAFNENRKQMLRDTMDGLLEGSDNAKDKSGIFLSRETQERNSIDVFGEETGKKINETIFRPVHDNEAKKTRFINKYVGRAKSMNLSKAESQAVQMLGEGKIAEHELPANMDKAKIKNAVSEFRKIYDGLLSLANEVLVNNGYAPVEYRKDYFPHFEDPKDPFVKVMKNLGFKVDNITLPTDIAGITHQFRPGKKWFGNFLRREGTNTTYDALEGFERYLYGISDVIYHTNDIQRLRAFETAIRSKYAPDNIKNRIAEIEQSGLSADDQQAAIDALFEIDKGHLGSYVTNLRSYTDTLAGKKSISDRNMEHKMGRATYNFLDNMNTQVAKNMVGWNVSSWLTNFIPIAQAGGGIKTKNLLKATRDTVFNYINDDGFRDKSTFLTNRKGTDRLTRSTIQKIGDAGLAPMEFIDDIATQILVRGKYLDNIERGMPHKKAMNNADSYVAGAVADRSKGALPTVFNTKNPLTKLFTLFQVEVNNQYSFLFKDLPREAKELGGKWLATALLKYMVGSYLYNEIYEKLAGRRPAPDLIGTVKKAIEKGTPLEAVQSVGEDVLEQTPFVGGILGGGRLPIGAALPDLVSVVKGEAKLGKEMLKPLTYLVSPIGGGGQAKKTIEGLKAYGQGASLSGTGRMRYPIPKTPFNALRTGLFGQYSTPEAREYFDKNRSTLSPNQTQQVMSSQDPQQAYLQVMQQRQINSLNQKLKEVAADDTLSRAEKDKKINEIRQKINELRD